MRLLASKKSPWQHFARQSQRFMAGDWSHAQLVVGWCVAADMVVNLIGMDAGEDLAESMLVVSYIARKAWRSAFFTPEEIREIKAEWERWRNRNRFDPESCKDLPARGYLEGIRMPWLGPLHEGLISLASASSIAAMLGVQDILVRGDQSIVLTWHEHWLCWAGKDDFFAGEMERASSRLFAQRAPHGGADRSWRQALPGATIHSPS